MYKSAIPVQKTVTNSAAVDWYEDNYGAVIEAIIITNQGGSPAVLTLKDGAGGTTRITAYAPATATTTIPCYGAKFVQRVEISTTQTVTISLVAAGVGES